MTVTSNITKFIYDGNDATIVFPYSFKIFLAADLTVILTGTDGVETELTEGVGYTLSGAGDADGGDVTYPVSGSPLATGEKLTLWRNAEIIQSTIVANQSGFFPRTVEDLSDLTTMIAQYLDEKIGRAFTIPISEQDLATEMPAVVPSSFPLVNAAGTAMEWATAGSLTGVTIFGAGLNLAGTILSVTNPVNHCVAGGTVDALTGALGEPATALTNNLRVLVEVSGANTSTTPTFDLDGLGAKTIVKGSNAALLAGDIQGADARIDLVFDASLDKWILMNPVDVSATTIQGNTLVSALDTGIADACVIALVPAITAYAARMKFLVKIKNANLTTTPTLDINGVGVKTIKRPDGTALVVGDLPANHWAEFVYDGTDMILQNPATVGDHDHSAGGKGGNLGKVQATDMTLIGSAASPPDLNTLTKESTAKAWGRLDGTGTPSYDDTFNISGAPTDNGTGDYTVIIDSNMADGNYSAVATSSDTSGVNIAMITAHAAGSFDIIIKTSSAASRDTDAISFHIMGAQ